MVIYKPQDKQFLRRDQRGLHMRRTVVDSQPWDSQMTIFSCLLQHKGAPIFQIKQPLFWKKRQISASLDGSEYPTRCPAAFSDEG